MEHKPPQFTQSISGKYLHRWIFSWNQLTWNYLIFFSPDSSLVCASSSHGTIHIFASEDSSKNKMSSLVSSATDFFGPASNKLLPKYFTSEWSFSKIDVPGGTRCICAFGANNNTVLAVCDDSSYHKFVYDDQKRQFIREVYQMFLEPDIETVESFWISNFKTDCDENLLNKSMKSFFWWTRS